MKQFGDRIRHVVLAVVFVTAPLIAQQGHSVTGIVLHVNRARHTMVVSCDEIPGYMSAMEMSFSVRSGQELASILPGAAVRFTMTTQGPIMYATHLQATIAANLEAEPMEAGSLSALQSALRPDTAKHVVEQGKPVPDFELTDQAGRQVRLSSLAGKVVLLTFGYSRCPNPDYCARLSNNLARVRDRFSARPRDLVLLTIAIDPDHDQGDALRAYAAVWKADPANWHFLTGPQPQIRQVAALFGMNYWRTEGFLTHSLHTVIIDRSGRLSANLEGNKFTPQQLGDLVGSIMDRPY